MIVKVERRNIYGAREENDAGVFIEMRVRTGTGVLYAVDIAIPVEIPESPAIGVIPGMRIVDRRLEGSVAVALEVLRKAAPAVRTADNIEYSVIIQIRAVGTTAVPSEVCSVVIIKAPLSIGDKDIHISIVAVKSEIIDTVVIEITGAAVHHPVIDTGRELNRPARREVVCAVIQKNMDRGAVVENSPRDSDVVISVPVKITDGDIPDVRVFTLVIVDSGDLSEILEAVGRRNPVGDKNFAALVTGGNKIRDIPQCGQTSE